MAIQSKNSLKNDNSITDHAYAGLDALQAQNMFSWAAIRAGKMVASSAAEEMPTPSTSQVAQAASHVTHHDTSPRSGVALVTTGSEERRMIAAGNAARANRPPNVAYSSGRSSVGSEVLDALPQLTFSLSEEGRMMGGGLAAFNNRQAGGASIPEAGPSAWRMIRTQTFVSPSEGALPSQYIQQQRAGHSRSASMYSTSSSHIPSPRPLRSSSSQGSSGRASEHISISSMPGGTVITGITRDDMQVPAIAHSTVVVRGQDGGYRALSQSELLSSFFVQARTPAPQGTGRELTLQSFFRLADQRSLRRSMSAEQPREDYFTLSPEVSRIADRRAQNIYISDQEIASLYQQMAQNNKAATPRQILNRIFGAEGRGTWKDGLVNKYLPLYQSGEAVPTPPRLGDQSALSSEQSGLSVASSASWGLPMGPPRADMRGPPLIEFIQAAALRRSNSISQASAASSGSSDWGALMGPPRPDMRQGRSQSNELVQAAALRRSASSRMPAQIAPPPRPARPAPAPSTIVPTQAVSTPPVVNIIESYIAQPGLRYSDSTMDHNSIIQLADYSEITMEEAYRGLDHIMTIYPGSNALEAAKLLLGVQKNDLSTQAGRDAIKLVVYYQARNNKDQLAQRQGLM